jgi:hypothetical protein
MKQEGMKGVVLVGLLLFFVFFASVSGFAQQQTPTAPPPEMKMPEMPKRPEMKKPPEMKRHVSPSELSSKFKGLEERVQALEDRVKALEGKVK